MGLNIEGLRNYIISYSETGTDGKHHYSHAELIYKSYLIKVRTVYYETLDEAVEGLKQRIIQAGKDFDLKQGHGKN